MIDQLKGSTHQWWLAVLILALCFLPGDGALADEIVLHNGDRLTGTLLSAEDGKLVLETAYAGKVSISMAAVASIETEAPHTLRFKGSEILKGRLRTEDGTVQLLPSQEREMTSINWDRVRSINVPDTQWSGSVFLGGTHQAGNSERMSVSAGAEATRRSREDRFNLSFLYNYAEEDGELTARDSYGAVKYDYFFTERFYGLLSMELLKDKFKDLNLRAVAGPGIGYQIWEDERKALGLEAGLAYFSEDRIDGEDDQWFTARLAAKFRYQLTARLKFTESLILYPQLESFGEYTLRNEAALITSLGKSWALRLSNVWERDSDPAENVKQDDFKSSLSLQYSF